MNEVNYSPCLFKGNGATKDFPFEWKVLEIGELIVSLISETGEEKILKLGSEWNARINLVGGNVTLIDAPSSDYLISIKRKTSNHQSVGYSTSVGFQGSEMEKSFDRMSCCLQDMEHNIGVFKEEFSNEVEDNIQEFKDEINQTIGTVIEASEKIKEFEEGVETVSSKAKIVEEKTNLVVEISNEIQQQGFQAIEEIYKVGQSIVDTGIHTRATIDLDNITDKAKQDIQYQAKLANAPFCANSGNIVENGNADLLYLPTNTETIEIPWQNPTLTTLTDYGTVTGDGFSNLLTLFDGSTALQAISIHTSNLYWSFPKDKKIFLNKISIYFGDQGSVSGSAYNASLNLYKNDELVKTVTVNVGASFAYRITEFEKTECDRIHLYIDGYNHNTVPTRIGEIIFSGTEIVDFKTNDSCYFKIGGDYPNIVVTNTEHTFEKSYVKPINLNELPQQYISDYSVVGTLTDNGGVLSGFAKSNYGLLPLPFQPADKTWEMYFKVTTPSEFAEFGFIIGNSTSNYNQVALAHNNNKVKLYVPINGTDYEGTNIVSDYELLPDTTYYIKCKYNGVAYTCDISTDNETWETIITIEESSPIFVTTEYLSIGNNWNTDYYWTGTIDVKECYIKKDNQIVWNCFGVKNGTYNVFVSETKDPYMLANTIYKQKTEPSPKFVQPILTANGTMGGDSFAVESSSILSGTSGSLVYGEPYYAFDNNTNTAWHGPAGEFPQSITFYNPKPLNVTNLKFTNWAYTTSTGITSGVIYGSHDNIDWVKLTTFTNSIIATNQVWDIDLTSNKNYYKYYKIQVDTSSYNYAVIGGIDITATIATQDNDIWLNTSIQPYKAYKFNGIIWEEFSDVPIGSLVVERKIISTVETFPYNITAKEETVSWGMPDYTAGISIVGYTTADNQFIAPCDGIIVYTSGSNNNIYTDLYLNDVVFTTHMSGTTATVITRILPLNKGDRIYSPRGYNTYFINAFYPLKGVN